MMVLHDGSMIIVAMMIIIIMMMVMVCAMCRKTGEEEVRVKVLYCGICHSDLHCLKNEWHSSTYPLVPGYAIFFFFLNNIIFVKFLVMLKKLLSLCRLDYSPSKFCFFI